MYENVIRSLGSVFDNRKLYGEAHKVTVQSLENAFTIITETLSSDNIITFIVNPEEFSINNKVVATKNPLMLAFVERLRGHEISTLTISEYLSPDEFLRFIDLLSQTPEMLASSGGITGCLNSESFTHISSRKVTYVEIADEEIVVNKNEVGSGSGSKIDEYEATVLEYLGVSPEEPIATAGPAVEAGMQVLIGNPSEMGEIIVKSAGLSMNVELPPESPLPPGTIKDLIDRIVECLERAFEVLKEDKSARSQTGKNKLSKSLKSLEKDLEKFIKEAVTPVEDDDLNPIYSAIDAMTDELEIDALAAEYLRKRKLIEKSEKRLLKYMKNSSEENIDEGLKNKLIDGGLSKQSWDMLLMASGKKQSKSEKWVRNTELPEYEQLQEKLRQLSRVFCNINPDNAATPEQLQEIINQVEAHLEKLIKNTERRIKIILNKIIADEKNSDSRETESSKRLTRRQLLELIAEIVQELYQPLSVVQCVLQSTLSSKVDFESKKTREFLELADRSAQRLNFLINELYTVVGNPTSLTPNRT